MEYYNYYGREINDPDCYDAEEIDPIKEFLGKNFKNKVFFSVLDTSSISPVEEFFNSVGISFKKISSDDLMEKSKLNLSPVIVKGETIFSVDKKDFDYLLLILKEDEHAFLLLTFIG